jgi:hypothetical protein
MKPITDISQLDLTKQYTYADYLTWQFDDRLELIKGWIYRMSPAPKRKHQRIEAKIFSILFNHLDKCSCQVYNSPFDVRLKKNKGTDAEVDTIVQPDISVFCDLTKLDDRGAIDAPDLVVEITSESTMKRDYNDKFNLYEANGVQEYWIVNPDSESIEVFKSVNNTFESIGVFKAFDGFTEVTSVLFPDLTVNLVEAFKD